MKEKLDAALHEHLDNIINKHIINKSLTLTDLAKRCDDCIDELRRQYYRRFEAKRAEKLALEVLEKGKEADIAKLIEEGIEPSTRLREVDAHRNRKRPELRR